MQLLPHIILMLEGFSAFLDETCDYECDNSPEWDWHAERQKCIEKEACFPSMEQLRTLCPQTLKFLNCKRYYSGCEVEEDNANLSMLTKYSTNMEKIVREVCNEYSSFYYDYKLKSDCYKARYFDVTNHCWNRYNETKQGFIEHLDIAYDVIPDEIKCIMIIYQYGCLEHWFERICGKPARRIFLRTQRAFEGLFSLNCSGVNEEWRLKFKNFLPEQNRWF